MILATVKYDFATASWVCWLDDDITRRYSGTTPDEALSALKFDYDKHNLWPKER